MKIAIAAGGTGGHIYPAGAFANYAQSHGAEVVWIGSNARMEKDIVKTLNVPFMGFGIERPSEHPLWLVHDITAWFAIRNYLKTFKADCVVSAGGYISFFAASAARSLGIPYFMMEQNAFPGRVTRMMQKKAQAIFTAFEESKTYFKSKTNVLVTGNPVRNDIKKRTKTGNRCVVMGGSLGARAVNEAVKQLLNEGFFESSNIPVLWITGTRDYESIKAAVNPGTMLELCEYRHDMAAVFAEARCMIARAGAMTVSECAVSGIPMLLVPYPYAKDDHQRLNAEAVEKRGGGKVITESVNLTGDLKSAISMLWNDPARLDAMSMAIRTLMPDNAEEIIWKEISRSL